VRQVLRCRALRCLDDCLSCQAGSDDCDCIVVTCNKHVGHYHQFRHPETLGTILQLFTTTTQSPCLSQWNPYHLTITNAYHTTQKVAVIVWSCFKKRLTDTDPCPCGETQTTSHIVESCPLTKLNGRLSRLHSADEGAVLWLTSYGLWHAYEKKKKKEWQWQSKNMYAS